ncbi:hypothetical protein ACQ4M3_39450 [Leptolyngbya sp. AN03gr2]|uniref:hypothetical protein n=1 Tax=unclassified Leptolyngbya TaxID=2650499 RepID=UPI003D316479
MSRINYVTVLTENPRLPGETSSSESWLLEGAVDRERGKLILTVPIDTEKSEDQMSPPSIEVLEPVSEEFKLAIASVAQDISLGFIVWRKLLQDATDEYFGEIRFASLLFCLSKWRDFVRTQQAEQEARSIQNRFGDPAATVNPFGMELGDLG